MISIIGAGPAGCYTSYILAKQGYKVNLFEKKKTIGTPVQCSGLVTHSIKKKVKLDENIITNKIKNVKIHSKKHTINFTFKKPNYVLDRAKFDKHLAKLAETEGAKIFLKHNYIKNTKNKILTNKGTFKHNILVGSDGPLSKVAKTNQLINNKNRKFWTGIQAIAKLKNENSIQFYPSIGTLAWIIPENSTTVRIGVLSENNAKQVFDQFIKNKIKTNNILEIQAGVVPVYNPKIKIQKNNVFLIGDAAGQVKATTGGGIIHALTASKVLANSITENKNYDKECRRVFGKDLMIHLLMRRILDKFNDKDWDFLLSLAGKKSIKSLLETFDRDYPSKFILSMLLKEPKFLYFSKFLI